MNWSPWIHFIALSCSGRQNRLQPWSKVPGYCSLMVDLGDIHVMLVLPPWRRPEFWNYRGSYLDTSGRLASSNEVFLTWKFMKVWKWSRMWSSESRKLEIMKCGLSADKKTQTICLIKSREAMWAGTRKARRKGLLEHFGIWYSHSLSCLLDWSYMI